MDQLNVHDDNNVRRTTTITNTTNVFIKQNSNTNLPVNYPIILKFLLILRHLFNHFRWFFTQITALLLNNKLISTAGSRHNIISINNKRTRRRQKPLNKWKLLLILTIVSDCLNTFISGNNWSYSIQLTPLNSIITANIYSTILPISFFISKLTKSTLSSSLSSFTLLPFVHSLPSSINVGAVFTHDRIDQEIAFKLAIKRINADRIILPNTKLIPKIEHVQKHDSFHADKKVCGLLKTGVVAIFDPLDGYISKHLQSICDALDIPHLETNWDFTTKRDDLSVNLYPKPNVLTRAYVDLVKAWGWEHFAIIYEDNEGLIRLQDFFKEAEAMNWRIKLHQFKPGKPYRETFWKVKNDDERNIILDVKNKNIFRALKHAQQVGLITESHSYLITQLDLHTIDLEDFKFGKTKITAFKLIDDSNEELKLLREDWRTEFPKQYTPDISTESALIYDAVKLLATAIRELDHGQSIEISEVSCESSVPWSHGSSLINYMRPIEFRGITGLVGFNDQGFRSSITLYVVTVSPNGLEEIGTWSEDTNLERRLNISRDWSVHYSSSALENKTLIITTVLNNPYTMIKDSSFKRIGNDQFEGYAIDLILELSKLLHFSYEFRLVKDGAYGRPNKNGNWNGMMGELIRGEADLAVADLTITSKREDVVDFTHPFMNTGISILYKKPTKKVTSLFSFLSPFSNIVWIYVVCAYVGVSTMLFIVGRLSPYEWENPHPCRQNEQVLENAFSLSNSFWFTIGSLMQQASDLTPKAMSTRTIASIWYFFTLIMIASYTANLAAFLTVEKIVYPIENAEGLAAQEKIRYGCLGSGSTASFFAESNITTYKKMWGFMSKNPNVFMKSNEEGRKMVEKADGMYAFLMESASIEYIIERDCNLTQIGGLLDSKGYGIATRKDSPYRTPLSQAILKLQESGALLTLKERWWKQKKGGGQCIDDPKKSSGSVTPLKIDNVGGVFVVLLGGLSFSLLVVILEFVWKARYEQNDPNETICEEMLHDLKFALKCQSSSKIMNPKDPKQAHDNESIGVVPPPPPMLAPISPTPLLTNKSQIMPKVSSTLLLSDNMFGPGSGNLAATGPGQRHYQQQQPPGQYQQYEYEPSRRLIFSDAPEAASSMRQRCQYHQYHRNNSIVDTGERSNLKTKTVTMGNNQSSSSGNLNTKTLSRSTLYHSDDCALNQQTHLQQQLQPKSSLKQPSSSKNIRRPRSGMELNRPNYHYGYHYRKATVAPANANTTGSGPDINILILPDTETENHSNSYVNLPTINITTSGDNDDTGNRSMGQTKSTLMKTGSSGRLTATNTGTIKRYHVPIEHSSSTLALD